MQMTLWHSVFGRFLVQMIVSSISSQYALCICAPTANQFHEMKVSATREPGVESVCEKILTLTSTMVLNPSILGFLPFLSSTML